MLPVGLTEPEPGLGRAWYPAVGLGLGAIAWAGLWLTSSLTTALLGAVAAVALMAALTGALHLDGLADTADGLLGGDTPERRLDIMRDPRLGSFGVVAVSLVILGDVAALAGLSHPAALAALVTAGVEARMAVVVVVLALPYVRASGLGTAAASGRRLPALALAGVTSTLPLLLDWRHGLLALALVAGTSAGIAWLARSRVAGATGDVYGTVVEVGQLAALAAFAVRL